MRKNFVIISTALCLMVLTVQTTLAQSLTKKAEIGGQFTLVKVSDEPDREFPLPGDIKDTLVGGGIRL
jgi:hypothetical protein